MNDSEMIRVLIADDHYIVRMGLIALINAEPDMEVVAEADNGTEALELFAKLRPDIALLDSRMPGKSGVQTATEIRSRFPAARILILSAFDGVEDIHRAFEAGVQGYVLKKKPSGEKVIKALRSVAAGKKWIPEEVVTQLVSRKASEELTARELQILKEIAKGLANKQVAEVLNITEYTVKDHLKHILAKLHASDRTEAVTTALQRGIIHL
jgi:DNA-binding NarL/FixJ family response regulator